MEPKNQNKPRKLTKMEPDIEEKHTGGCQWEGGKGRRERVEGHHEVQAFSYKTNESQT